MCPPDSPAGAPTMASMAGVDLGILGTGTLVGDFRIEGLIGQGGMGQVYGAIHPVIGKRAAIKVLRRELCSDAESIDRFVNEARAVNQIGHPNIVDVFAFGGLPDGRQYMAMEWLRGESLDRRLARGVIPLDEVCDILLAVCAALDAAHDKGIVHRDLKPHNLFLVEVKGARPLIKLLDFGLVKLMGPDEQRMERTRSGFLLGTPAYMSPEQARGRGVDYRTDLYALGVMAYQMVTHQLPFDEPSAMEMIVAHLQKTPPPPSHWRPGLPAALDALILALLAKDAGQRPSLQQVGMALRELQRQLIAGGALATGAGAVVGGMAMPGFAIGSVVAGATAGSGAASGAASGTSPGAAALPALTSGMASAVAPAPPRRGRTVRTIALLLVATVAVGVVAFVATRATRRSASTPAAPAGGLAPGVVADAAIAPAAAPTDAAMSPALAVDASVTVPPPVDAAPAPDARKRDRHGGDRHGGDRRNSPGPGSGSGVTRPPPDDDDDGTVRVLPTKR